MKSYQTMEMKCIICGDGYIIPIDNDSKSDPDSLPRTCEPCSEESRLIQHALESNANAEIRESYNIRPPTDRKIDVITRRENGTTLFPARSISKSKNFNSILIKFHLQSCDIASRYFKVNNHVQVYRTGGDQKIHRATINECQTGCHVRNT